MQPPPSLEQLDVRSRVDVEQVTSNGARTPLERARERCTAHERYARAVAPDAVEDDAQVPVGQRVAEEEEVAAAEPAASVTGTRRSARSAEVVDVVVLGDDEALPLALRDDRPAVELEEDRATLERQLR